MTKKIKNPFNGKAIRKAFDPQKIKKSFTKPSNEFFKSTGKDINKIINDPNTGKQLNQAFKPLVKLAESMANNPNEMAGDISNAVKGISSNLSLPLVLIGGAIAIYMIQKKL